MQKKNAFVLNECLLNNENFSSSVFSAIFGHMIWIHIEWHRFVWCLQLSCNSHWSNRMESCTLVDAHECHACAVLWKLCSQPKFIVKVLNHCIRRHQTTTTMTVIYISIVRWNEENSHGWHSMQCAIIVIVASRNGIRCKQLNVCVCAQQWKRQCSVWLLAYLQPFYRWI